VNAYRDRDTGAADKAAIQLVNVQPVSVSRIGHVVMPHLEAGNQPSYAWYKRPGRPEDSVLQRWVQPGGLAGVGA
jgi:hypothetical protein